MDVQQLKEGKILQKKYGLRRKKEIWISQGILRNFRQRARKLIAVKNPEQEKILLEKLSKMGLLPKDSNLDAVLGLTIEDILGRRLETITHKKGLAKTPRQARQAIVHGHLMISGRKVYSPSMLVNSAEEELITSTFKIPEPPSRKKAVKEEENG